MLLKDWIELLSNGLIAVIAIFGAIYGVRQVREARKSRLLGPYFEMDRRIHDQREDRRALYSWKNAEYDDDWRKIFEKVVVTFDVLGVLVREDMIYRPIVFKLYYDVIIKIWDTTKVYIYDERRTKKRAETYMSDFEYLFNEAEKYAKRQGLPYPGVKQQ